MAEQRKRRLLKVVFTAMNLNINQRNCVARRERGGMHWEDAASLDCQTSKKKQKNCAVSLRDDLERDLKLDELCDVLADRLNSPLGRSFPMLLSGLQGRRRQRDTQGLSSLSTPNVRAIERGADTGVLIAMTTQLLISSRCNCQEKTETGARSKEEEEEEEVSRREKQKKSVADTSKTQANRITRQDN